MKGTLAAIATLGIVGMLFQLLASSEVPQPPTNELIHHRRQLRSSIPPLDVHRRRRLVESGSIRFAWGIVGRAQDEDLREVLRKTYLNDPRICILSDSTTMDNSCRMAYTFVLPLKVLEDDGDRAPSAPDITYLPMNDRLSLLSSWFRYAANTDVDYVAKVDATTLAFPDKFLEMAQDVLGLPSMYRVIGGVPKDRWDCGGFSKWKCRQMQPTYMSSNLYFLSTDLATAVPLDISDQEPDRLANWLTNTSPQLPTMQVTIKQSHGLWEDQGEGSSSLIIQERWDYLKSHQFSRHLVRSDQDAVPRWNGTSLLDEFYRRIPWRYIPNSLTRFNLP
jgi:hypothetical protein